jgi:hypothetical protein
MSLVFLKKSTLSGRQNSPIINKPFYELYMQSGVQIRWNKINISFHNQSEEINGHDDIAFCQMFKIYMKM